RPVVPDRRHAGWVSAGAPGAAGGGPAPPEGPLLALPFPPRPAVVAPPRPPATPTLVPFWTLTIRIGVAQSENVLTKIFEAHVEEAQLMATSTGRQGAALDLTYKLRLRPTTTPAALVAELHRLGT